MSNRKDGTDFEKELCEILREYGIWAYNCPSSRDGQPADIIACRNGMAYLIDAKVCKSDVFPFSRIEENQRWSMNYFAECGNPTGLFALKVSDGIYIVPLSYIRSLEMNGATGLSFNMIHQYGREVCFWAKHIA